MMSGSASLANSTIGVGQLLAAIGMNISIVQTQSHKLDSAGARAISENAMLVEEVSREIRTISRLFHPPLLDLAGLVSALRWYVDGFSERRKIKVDLDIPFDFGRLPDEVEIAIFRIVQECLTNIHRHSGGATANIGLYKEADRLTVRVRDNRKGIPKERQRELLESGRAGIAFGGMRERLRQLDGSLEIQSEGTGTTVIARFKVAWEMGSARGPYDFDLASFSDPGACLVRPPKEVRLQLAQA
jgi:two-component system NarL family sensor kinase